MTRLLVSVRDAGEARVAMSGGAQLIDVKEPRRGSLGASEPKTIASVVHEVAGRVPVSAALGELLEYVQSPELATLEGVRYVKLGLAGCQHRADWPTAWSRKLAHRPVGSSAVAVAYADWRTAVAPSPADVLIAARSLECSAFLLDTFDKSRGTLFDHWPIARLKEFLAMLKDAGLMTVIAGSLTAETIRQVMSLSPDVIAVRGAACRGRRDGAIDASLVRELVKLVA